AGSPHTNPPHPPTSAPRRSGARGRASGSRPRPGLRPATGKPMTDTTQLIDVMLARNVGTGVGYYRYNYDGYGEDYRGANWTGIGIGRLWPLLAAERGHLAVLAGQDRLIPLTAMLNMRTPRGLLPAQVWDQPPLRPSNARPPLPL